MSNNSNNSYNAQTMIIFHTVNWCLSTMPVHHKCLLTVKHFCYVKFVLYVFFTPLHWFPDNKFARQSSLYSFKKYTNNSFKEYTMSFCWIWEKKVFGRCILSTSLNISVINKYIQNTLLCKLSKILVMKIMSYDAVCVIM